MNAVLVSQRVADTYGARMGDILKRADRSLEVAVFSLETPPSAAQCRNLEIAFYSRDVWEGTDKTYVNPQTIAFFAVVDAAPNLRWLQVTSAGADLPMYQPSLERGVRVTTSSGSNAEPIAHTAIAAILNLSRGMLQWGRAQREHRWAPLRGTDQPRDLSGQTAVVVGTGPIGKSIARVLRILGLQTVGVRRSAMPTEHFDRVTTFQKIDDLLPDTQWLVIACPLTETTRGLIDQRRLALLPTQAHVVNVARGEIVDEPALIDALEHGRIAGAYLDVFAVEPLPAESPLWDMPNVILTPHNCSASLGNYGRGDEIFLRNLERYLGGQPLENEVG
jgi:phosphoglycerate dehydrogenase-like enzyme